MRPRRRKAPEENVVLKVPHHGMPKMVGKVFRLMTGELVFLHDSTSTQFHQKMDSPGGIDEVVLDWLLKNGVSHVLHRIVEDRMTHRMWAAPVTRVIDRGLRQTSDGRNRVYLGWTHWDEVEGEMPPPPWIEKELVLEAPAPVQGSLL